MSILKIILTVICVVAILKASPTVSSPLHQSNYTRFQGGAGTDKRLLRGVATQGQLRENLPQSTPRNLSTKLIHSQTDRRIQDRTLSDCGCSEEIQECREAAHGSSNHTTAVKKCELYNFECLFLCYGTSGWTCEDHCISDFNRCLIAQDDEFCNLKKSRCIGCCPEEPTSLPSSSPSSFPIPSPTSSPTSNPTKGPTASPSFNPTSQPSISLFPTREGGNIIIGVPIYPNTATLKKIVLPQSSQGVLFKLVKKVSTDCEDATSAPYSVPTTSPTKSPTASPTVPPTLSPTSGPTVSPTSSPIAPTPYPTSGPTQSPTSSPTSSPIPPTPYPTSGPTPRPSSSPTLSPIAPTPYPTRSPTMEPTPNPSPATTLNNEVEYVLLSGNQYDKCPGGWEIRSQEECLSAANAITTSITTITNRETGPLVSDWAGLPCGCFIWNDELIDYDTNCDNRALHQSTKLVCRKNNYLLLQGSQYDKCPDGLEVSSEQCLDAANSLTEGITTIDNRGSLLEGDWSNLPCGCFIFQNIKIDYDHNCNNRGISASAEIVCKQNIFNTPTSAPTTSQGTPGNDYILLRGSEYNYDKCPDGQEVPKSECRNAANSVTVGVNTITNRETAPFEHDWNFTPCGCFVWDSTLIDYDPGCHNRKASASADLVCKKASNTQRALNNGVSYVLLSGLDYDRCPTGLEVNQDDCRLAANSVSVGWSITNRDTGPFVNDWANLPCGCFIWDKKLIDFDSNCNNSGKHEFADLVCLDPSLVTSTPSAAPVPAPPKPPIIFPAGRSYDGNGWEATHPIILSYSCDNNNQCTVDLPPEECGGIYYTIEKFESEPLSAEKDAARMLIQATFGPTRESINDFVNKYSNPSDWVKDQMNQTTMPISSHREHYRKRSNSHVRQGLDGFGLRDACNSGSRWNRWAFNRYRDVGKVINLEPKNGRYIMRIDSIPRTEVDPSALELLNSGTFFNINGLLYICRGMSEFVSQPDAKLILANSPSDCGVMNKVGHIKMPSVEFFTDPVSLGLHVPEVILNDLTPTVLDVKLLSSLIDPCTLKKSWPNLVKDKNTGQYYVEDRRVELLELNSSNVSGSGLSTKICPSAPKTFLNEGTCIVRSDCSVPTYQQSSGFLTLNAENVRKFYTLAGHFVYRVNGLPIITDPLSRYEMVSPCNDAVTYKRFDWDPFRFVRKNAPNNGCSVTTTLDQSISTAISQALAGELAKISDFDERNNKRVLDVVMPKNSCIDPLKAARGASFNVYDETLGKTTCWTHSHPNEWSVYNFDKWVMTHPGNLNAYLSDKKNPIAAFAEAGENIESSVTLEWPSYHPSDRFQDTKSHREYVGNWGDKISFSHLPSSIQENEVAATFNAIPMPEIITEYIEVCESPFEVSNDPALGHQYRLQKGGDTGEMGIDSLDQDGWGWNGKNRVWNTISTFAQDQLRQRVAWVLSSIFVVTAIDINTEHSTEAWSSYHDIFVRNAFGNYFDVLKEVSFHPLMAKMLTYHESKSMSYNFEKDGVMLFPDENYAREIMQLFSIGLYKLNRDGTKMFDNITGKPVETYTNEDIMTFARAWTNFQRQDFRPNLEVYADFVSSDNEVDPMFFPTTDGRDVFPKLGLDDGGRAYIGDKVKRCDAMPNKPWLRKGAKYVFRGSNPNPELNRKDPVFWDDYPTINRIILDKSSNLHAALCNIDQTTGACRFNSTVVLTQDIQCVGTCTAGESDDAPIVGTQPCECSIDEPRTIRVDDPSSTNGSPPSVWYEYVRDACVQMAFPETSHMKTVSEIGKHWGNYGNDAMCADTRLAVAGTTCCDVDNTNPRNLCVFRGERTTYNTAKQRCEEKGLVTCPWSSVPISHYCGTDIEWWGGQHDAIGMRFSWTSQDCSMNVQINEKGYIAMVHDIGPLSQEVKGRVRVDFGTYFRVLWQGDIFPTLQDCGGMPFCRIHGQTCICGTSVQTVAAFDGTKLPTKEELLTELHIGAPDPALFDIGTYYLCNAPACLSLSSDFSMYLTQVIDSDNDIAAAINENTIFEVVHPVTRQTVYLSNTKSTVHLGSDFAFRNPPIFNSPVDQTQRDALYETDAVLQHYATHSNTAPFISMRLIQHLVTSNPSPRYVNAVSDAFTRGTYDGFGSGKYGDLEAAVAAVFLDSEARSPTLDLDSTFGKAREPLLKVLHIFRSMELGTMDGRDREVDLIFMKDKIGQESHYAPSVFSFFLPEYQPIGPVLNMGLVAPETQLFDAPKLIGFLNGLVSLSYYGIQDCESGFGTRFDRYVIPDHPDAHWNGCYESRFDVAKQVPHRLRWVPTNISSPVDVVSEMDLLLTAGRLSSTNKQIIANAYENKAAAENEINALQYAISHFAATPEFHVTNHLFSNETVLRERILSVPTIPNQPPPVSEYKAIVYLYMAGALDSYNLLMPLTCSGDLNTMYHHVRGHVAVPNHLQLPINAPLNSQQPCTRFGVHPKMGYLQQLYSIGEASFVANIGPLFEPITDKGEFERGSKRTPPSLFAHNIQTSETQGVATGDSKAGGVLGRIGDALNSQAGKEIFDAYSISGTPKVLEGAPGVSRPADVLTEVGVATFTQTASEIETNIQEMNKYVANSIYGETFSDSISSAIARKNLLGGTIEESSLPQQTESCYANLERLETGIALQFKQVSRIIQQRDKLQAKRDVFYLQLGGFDAHGGDGYTGTANLLSEINDSLPCFVNDLKNQGLWNDVTIMSASEFGRTLTSNGQGTDHAWGGNHFLMGGAIAGAKIHGVYPDDLTDEGPLNIGRGRLIPTTPWEGVWKGVAEWFGVNNENMGTVLPNLENFQSNVFSKSDLYK